MLSACRRRSRMIDLLEEDRCHLFIVFGSCSVQLDGSSSWVSVSALQSTSPEFLSAVVPFSVAINVLLKMINFKVHCLSLQQSIHSPAVMRPVAGRSVAVLVFESHLSQRRLVMLLPWSELTWVAGLIPVADRAIYFTCVNFFFFLLWAKLSQYLLGRFSRSFHQMEGICVNFLDPVHFFPIPQGTLPWRISLNISGHTGWIFAIFSPYESVLLADDGSVPYFPICKGTLPWQPNNVATMKANWYYVHCLHDCQMVARFWFATTC